MPVTTNGNLHRARTTLDTRYRDLANAWMSHQALRVANAPLGDLADSSGRLFRMQMAMGSWHSRIT